MKMIIFTIQKLKLNALMEQMMERTTTNELLAIDSLIVRAGGLAISATSCFCCKIMLQSFHAGALCCARCVALSSWRWTWTWGRVIIWGWYIFVTKVIITMTNPPIIIHTILMNMFVFACVSITLKNDGKY